MSMSVKHFPRDALRFVRATYQIARLRQAATRSGVPHALPGKLVVSLTSYPPRFKALDMTLRCLLAQDTMPDAVVLWIARKDRGQLPRRVEALQDRGLTIRECADLRSFNKIVHALAAYPDAFIAICDDDMLYPRDWLCRLVEGYGLGGEAVCQHAKRFTIGADGYPLPYSEWPGVKVGERPSTIVQPMGSAGVLYPPGFFPARTLDDREFMSLCPEADDLWLYWMFASAGKQAHKVKPVKMLHRPGTQAIGLKQKNDYAGGNDRQIAQLVAAYGLPWRAEIL